MRMSHRLFMLVFAIVFATAHLFANTDAAKKTTPVKAQGTDAGIIVDARAPGDLVDFSSESEDWVIGNLTIGPIELLSTGFLPLAGAAGGGVIGGVIPFKGMQSDWCALLLPYTIPAGIGGGAVIGALLAPVVAIEGVFDTLTFGAFADKPFDWFGSPHAAEEIKDIEELDNAPDTTQPEL